MPYKPSPELDYLIENILGDEKSKFFASIGGQLPHTIRFNSLKGEIYKLKRFLEEQDFLLEEFPGFSDIFRLTYQPFPIGKSLSHFLGHFYVQDIASMLPPRILDPQPGECVLDVSAAPGSKTTQMAVMMKNEGMILANDIVHKRLRSLINNLQRMGILNTAVVKTYGESIGKQYFEIFDKILLDPACSGLGTLHKSPEILSWWTPKHCERLASSQRALMSSAIKALKPGGLLVYSTCTLTPQENEEIIQFALNEFPIEVIPFKLEELKARPGLVEFRGEKFDKSLLHTKRLYPFENQTEGFFVAKIMKIGKMKSINYSKYKAPFTLLALSDKTSPVKKYLDYFSSHFGIKREIFSNYKYFCNNEISVFTKDIADFQFKSKPIKVGLKFAKTMTHIGKLTTEGIHLFGTEVSKNFIHLETLPDLENFVNRLPLNNGSSCTNQVAVKFQELPIGYGLVEENRIKSQFPKVEWPFQIK
jgi:NOL1/NOP2/sun family putative RNA methylase